MRGVLEGLREYLIPKDAEIQVAAFNILAVCGMAVSLLTAVINLFSGNNLPVVLGDLSGVLVAAGLIVYCHKTGRIMIVNMCIPPLT